MFSLMKQEFIVLFSFNKPSAWDQAKYLDLKPLALKSYPFMFSLGKCSAGCNVLSPKICVPQGTKDIHIKCKLNNYNL